MTSFVEYQNELSRINESACAQPEAFVARTEAAYHQSISDISQSVARLKRGCDLVMLSGPSGSGKTTTANLLKDAFQAIDIDSEIISLDDFYRGERQAPLLANGQHDYESPDALNVPEIQECLFSLMMNHQCEMPVFNFKVRMPYAHRRKIVLKERSVAIVEGIHALNPALIAKLPESRIVKVYISVKQGIFEQKEQLFKANEVRLLRRIVRDYNFRGMGPERTLQMWPAVIDGEKKYIKPFRGNADYTINSLHAYELCVLSNQAVPLLKTVSPESEAFASAKGLLGGLEKFVVLPAELVPKNSILREFIGGGIYS